MKVRELIERLSALDPSLPVYWESGDSYECAPVSNVTLGETPVIMAKYPNSVDHYVPGVWLS